MWDFRARHFNNRTECVARLAALRAEALELESASIEQQVKTIRRSLGRVRTIKTKLTELGACSDVIGAQAEQLREEIKEAITSIEDALRSAIAGKLWLGDWILEFASDWLATFGAGGSFAWSNLRLYARMSTDVFGTAGSHPADAARTQGILEMLARVAGGQECRQVGDRWNELLETIGASEPQHFRIAYPQSLIRELAIEAKRLFETAGLQPYNPRSKPIAGLLDEAWERFQADPGSFSRWEADQIGQLKKTLGLRHPARTSLQLRLDGVVPFGQSFVALQSK